METTKLPFSNAYLGDRGFLSRYGSKKNNAEIEFLMTLALRLGIKGIAAGDSRLLEIASRAIMGTNANLMFHTGCLLTAKDDFLLPSRLSDTAAAWVAAWSPRIAQSDPMTKNSFQRQFNLRLSKTDLLELRESNETVEETIKSIDKYRPQFVSCGGDWLDVCLISGRHDLISKVWLPIREACKISNSKIVFLTYLGPLASSNYNTIKRLEPDGIMCCINPLGIGMYPSKEKFINWIQGSKLPLTAIHVRATGLCSTQHGVNYALNNDCCSSIIVGASSPNHIHEYAKSLTNYDK